MAGRATREGTDAEGCGIPSPHDRRDAVAVADELERGLQRLVGAGGVERHRHALRCGGADAVGEALTVGDGLAPSSRSRSKRASDDVATTVAPHSTANWIAAWPTAPDPPCMSSVSPAPTPSERSDWYAVPDRDADRRAPWAALTCGGRGCTRSAGTTTSVAYAPDAPKNEDRVARTEAVDARADGGDDPGAVAIRRGGARRTWPMAAGRRAAFRRSG